MQELNKPKNSQSYPNSCQAPLVLSPSFMNLMLTAITYRNFNGKMEVGPHCLRNETYRDTIVGSDGKFSSFFSMAWCPKGSLLILLTAFSSVFNLHRCGPLLSVLFLLFCFYLIHISLLLRHHQDIFCSIYLSATLLHCIIDHLFFSRN